MTTRQGSAVFTLLVLFLLPTLGEAAPFGSSHESGQLDYRLGYQLRQIRSQIVELQALAIPRGQSAALDEILTNLDRAEAWNLALARGVQQRTEAQIHFYLYSLRSDLQKTREDLGLASPIRGRAPAAGTISGTVTGSDLTPPGGLVDVYVEFFDTNFAWVNSVLTDSNGDYVSPSLPDATYYAKTTSFYSYVDELYDDIPCSNICDMAGEGTTIVVNGGPVGGIDFELDPGGTISGTITDVDGGALLEFVYIDLFDGSGQWVSNAVSQVDGTYTSFGLPAGSYYARTWNDLHYINELYDNVQCPFSCDPTTSGGTSIAVTVGVDTGGKNFALALGGWISGNVIETGAAALADVVVEVFSSTGLPAGWGTTDGSGDYESNAGLPTGDYYARTLAPSPFLNELYDDFTCFSWCDVTTGTAIPVVAGVEKTDIDFGLLRGGMISGTVTDTATTNGIVGIWVEFFDLAGMHVGSTLTQAAGVYTSPPLPAATYYARTWNDLNYVNELFQEIPCPFGCDETSGTPIPVIANTTVILIDFTLDFGATISGTVTEDPSGLPIQDVRLQLYDSNGDILLDIPSDSNGDYTTPGLPASTYYVKAANDLGYLNEVYDNFACPNWCDVTGGTPLVANAGDVILAVNFQLQLGGMISGTVTEDPSGLPIQGVMVDIFDSLGNHVSHGGTDANGDYVIFYALAPGIHYARTWNDLGYVDELYSDTPCPSCDPTGGTPINVVAGGTEVIDFDLIEGGWISGTVLEDGSHNPIPDVHVDIFDSQGEFVTFGPTDSNGDYTIYNALPAGGYYARAWAENPPHLGELHDDIPCHFECDVTSGTAIAVTAGASTDIDFGLAIGGFIAGTVTAVGGAPIEDVHVNIHNSSGVLAIWEATDASGAFTTTWPLPAGYYFVSTSSKAGYIHEVYDNRTCISCDVTRGRLVRVNGSSTTSGIDFELAPGGTISGSLTDEGTGIGIPRIRVHVHDSGGALLEGFLPDSNGDYVSPIALPTGDYFVVTYTMWGEGPRYINELYGGAPCLGQCDVTLATPVHVIAGTTTPDIDFVLARGGQISGTVLAAGTSAPIERSLVMLYDTTGKYMTEGNVNDAGEYTSSSGLPTGTYYASTVNAAGYVDELYSETDCLGGGDFCTVTSGTPIAITAAQVTHDINFTLALGGGWIEGAVTDERWGHGLPAANIEIYSPGGTLITRVGWPRPRPSDGSYKTCGLPAGTYLARLDSTPLRPDYADEVYDSRICGLSCRLETATPITVLTGQGTSDIDFTLKILLFFDNLESGDTSAWSATVP